MAKNHSIVEGVVSGIAGYGNCFGVPNLGGETKFEPCYSGNPLVNAFALGMVRKDEIFYGKATGTGNPVIYVGAKTGRDGIHGATMASEEFKEGSEQKRPNVQVGDPFMEKLLLEACLEAMKTGAIVGIQDMGAAGLTCSTCEMGARGGVGLDVELDLVPQRETGMTAYEIMLSESQERMLLVAEKGREDEVLRVFAKWGLDAVIVGTVRPEPRLRIRHHGVLVADIPNQSLTDDAPLYHRPVGTWKAPVPDRSTGSRAGCAGRGPRLPRRSQEASGKRQRLLQTLGARAVRHHGADQYRDRAGRRSRRDADQGHRKPEARWHERGPGDGSGRQRPLVLISIRSWARCTPLPKCARKVAIDRRYSRGRDKLPQLRQSRKAGDHGAAFGRHRRHRRGLHRAGHADHRRQCFALQRDPGRRHLSDARARHRGHHGRRDKAVPADFQQADDDILLLWPVPRGEEPNPDLEVPFDACAYQSVYRVSAHSVDRRSRVSSAVPAPVSDCSRRHRQNPPTNQPRNWQPSAPRNMPRWCSAACGARRPRSIWTPKPTCIRCFIETLAGAS